MRAVCLTDQQCDQCTLVVCAVVGAILQYSVEGLHVGVCEQPPQRQETCWYAFWGAVCCVQRLQRLLMPASGFQDEPLLLSGYLGFHSREQQPTLYLDKVLARECTRHAL